LQPKISECIKLKSKFNQLLKKCKKLNNKQQEICKEVQYKLCAVFPDECLSTSTKIPLTTKKILKIITTKTPIISTVTAVATATATTSVVNVPSDMAEFIKVPTDPDELRRRGEYCVRHGKEQKCSKLLTNLKSKYTTCTKKPKEEIGCTSFQTHLCRAFPKFPPCTKMPSKSAM
ncbi:unnamed protein product, partial [Didymodactylos carnosus]